MLRKLASRLFPSVTAEPPEPADALGPTALAMTYLRDGRLFFEASDRTRWREAGFWVSTGEVHVLDSTATDEQIGEVALAALTRSRVEVPVPARDARLEAGLFRAMGVRSRRAAMQGTRACIITREPPAGALRLEPQHNGGARGEGRGYSAIAEGALELPDGAPAAAVGRGLRTALDRATVVT